MLALTDFNYGSPLRDHIGWSLLILMIFTVVINFIKALYYDSKHFLMWVKKMLIKYKTEKIKKHSN